MATCAVDSRPTDTTLCGGCLNELLTALRDVPWLVEQLAVTLTRQARLGDRNGPRSSERPLPYDLGASDALDALTATLLAWARLIADRRNVHLDTPQRPETLAAWLRMWPTELATHPDAGDLHDEILYATGNARRTIDRRPDLKFVGPCDSYGATVLPDNGHNGCGEDLYAHLNAKTIQCQTPQCYAVYDVEQRRAWLLEAAVDQLRTARQLADELPWIAGVTITAKRIGMWATRGKLAVYGPHPQDPREAQRFRVGEVIDHARLMAEAQQQGHTASGAA